MVYAPGCLAVGVTEKRMGSVSPALSRWNGACAGLEVHPAGRLRIDCAFGGGLGVDGNADGEGGAVEGKNAGFGVDADADGGGDD